VLGKSAEASSHVGLGCEEATCEGKLEFPHNVEPYRFNGYYVRIDIFEGPIELLFYLVRRNEANICEIPIAEITHQFLEQLQLMREVNIAITSEFLTFAALLLYMKSALLLPEPSAVEELYSDEEQKLSEEEVRALLTKKLVEYSLYREAAEYLRERSERRALMFTRVSEDGTQLSQPEVVELGSVSVFDLLWALREALSRLPDGSKLPIKRRKVTVGMRMQAILSKLRSRHSGCMFWELCDDCETKLDVIVTFLALLELFKRGLIIIEQERPFAPIVIHIAPSAR
jgi:segregation and condensation protein A